MLWPIFLVLLAVYMLIVRWQNRKFHKIHEQLPLPPKYKQVPIFGHALLLLGSNQDRMEILQQLGRDIIDKCNGIGSGWLANRLYVVIAEPEAAEVVMKSCLDKDDMLNITKQLIGNGSIFAPVPIWRPRRKILAPNFGQKTLNNFVKSFRTNSAIMTEVLKTAAGNGDFPIIGKMMSYSMDSVCETILGVKLNSHSSSGHSVPQAFSQYCLLTASRLMKPWLYPDAIYQWTTAYPQSEKAVNFLKEYVNEIIKSKQNAIRHKGNDSMIQEDSKFKSLLDLMIESGSLSDTELQEEVLVLLLAGTDTTGTTSSFLSLMLAKYDNIQEKVYQEIKEIFGDSERHIEPDDLLKLKYLEAVIRETMRLYPVVPMTVRKVDKNVTLPSGVNLVPGVGVMLHFWAIHRHPKYWGPDPDVFRPERFLEGPLKHPYAYLPFSNGPRSCLGYQYAMMAIKTLFVHIIRRYRFLPSTFDSTRIDDELPTSFEIVLKHVHNFEIQLELRNC